jgi:DNA polymerase III alpha subunit
MPQEYQVFDLISFLKVQAAKDAGYPDTTDVRYMQTPQYQRMTEELKEFQRRGLVQLLRYLKYLVDFMRAHDIVWGVGRGSSVSSYVLFLIGVHKINPITYNLDWREFLR